MVFRTILAFDLSGAVAREVIEFYGEDTNAHPVGSGPYRLKHYTRSSKIVLEANPGYREKIWDSRPGDDPLDKEIAAQMKGKRLPAIGNVEISIMEETQSRWLAFEKGETDMEYQLWDIAPTFMTADGKLRPAFVKRGIKLNRTVDPEITYTYFNMQEKIGDQPNPLSDTAKRRSPCGAPSRWRTRSTTRSRSSARDRRSAPSFRSRRRRRP